jgi:hypothetical protein
MNYFLRVREEIPNKENAQPDLEDQKYRSEKSMLFAIPGFIKIVIKHRVGV